MFRLKRASAASVDVLPRVQFGELHYATPDPGWQKERRRRRTAERKSASFLMSVANSAVYVACLRVVAQLDIANALAAEGPMHVNELATRVQRNEAALGRVLRLAATQEIVTETKPGVFGLGKHGLALRTDSPYSVRDGVLAMTTPAITRSVLELDYSVLTGQPAADKVLGKSLFDFFADNPTDAREFHGGMGQISLFESQRFAAECPLPKFGRLVNVGGGQGDLLVEVLRRHPGLHGILFDRPPVLAGGHKLEGFHNDGGWETTPGDFFVEVPDGDFYVIQYVLHNWPDDKCVEILRNCRTAMAPGGRVYIHDYIVPPGNKAHPSKTMDVLMLGITTGRERTQEEFGELLKKAGLVITRVFPPNAMSQLSIVEAERA